MNQNFFCRILLTHDGSEQASEALAYAVQMASAFKSEVFVLQVTESALQVIARTEPTGFGAGIAGFSDEILKIEKKQALENLNRIKKELKTAGIEAITTFRRQGDSGKEIVKLVEEKEIDLVLMATHGRSGLGRILLGSVADYVVRNAKCPVLLVRRKE